MGNGDKSKVNWQEFIKTPDNAEYIDYGDRGTIMSAMNSFFSTPGGVELLETIKKEHPNGIHFTIGDNVDNAIYRGEKDMVNKGASFANKDHVHISPTQLSYFYKVAESGKNALTISVPLKDMPEVLTEQFNSLPHIKAEDIPNNVKNTMKELESRADENGNVTVKVAPLIADMAVVHELFHVAKNDIRFALPTPFGNVTILGRNSEEEAMEYTNRYMQEKPEHPPRDTSNSAYSNKYITAMQNIEVLTAAGAKVIMDDGNSMPIVEHVQQHPELYNPRMVEYVKDKYPSQEKSQGSSQSKDVDKNNDIGLIITPADTDINHATLWASGAPQTPTIENNSERSV